MSIIFGGWRLMRERDWESLVLDHAVLTHERDALRKELADVVVRSHVLAGKIDEVRQATTQQVRQAIRVILGCHEDLHAENVRLARRAEAAELEAEQLRAQLAERQP